MAKRTVGNNKIHLTGTTFKLPETTIVKFGANTLSTILGDKANLASPIFTGNVGIGTNTARAVLDIVSTSALLVPAGTAGQQPTGIKGMLRYNTGTNTFEGYSGTWSSLGTAAVTPVGITNVVATNDSWVVTTDNSSGVFGVQVTLADAPVVYTATANPFFTNTSIITANANWPSTIGDNSWSATALSTRSGGNDPWRAFSGIASSSGNWESGDNFSKTSGVGSSWIQLKYPARYILASFSIGWSNGQHLGKPLNWTIQGSNDSTTFKDIQSYTAGPGSYDVTNTHIPYMYWRVLITLIDPTDGTNPGVQNVNCSVGFNTIASNVKVGSAFKSSTNQFTIDMVDYAGYPVNIASGASQKFNILLTKDGQIVNEGLYTFTAPNTYSKAT